MTETVLSVRGDAQQTVAPDFAVLHGRLSVTRSAKDEAMRVAAGILHSVKDDLAALGAVPLTAGSERSALTWSAQSVITRDDHDVDPATGQHGPTGRVVAEVSLVIGVRAFDRLDALGNVLARHEAINLHHVGWHVDADNPGWPAVRSDAIRAAIAKGRDYAAALGGALLRVDQVADVGLLDSGSHEQAAHRSSRMSEAAVGLGIAGGGGSPTLDPVPQELSAVIDARFTATVAPLDGL